MHPPFHALDRDLALNDRQPLLANSSSSTPPTSHRCRSAWGFLGNDGVVLGRELCVSYRHVSLVRFGVSSM